MTDERDKHPPRLPIALNAALAMAVLAMGGIYGGPSPGSWRYARCTHRYGIAGGFSECTTCGIRKGRRT